jgi:hypothetical protein
MYGADRPLKYCPARPPLPQLRSPAVGSRRLHACLRGRLHCNPSAGDGQQPPRSFGIAGAPHEVAAGWRLDRWQPFHVGVARGPWGRRHFIGGIGLGSIVSASYTGAGLRVAPIEASAMGRLGHHYSADECEGFRFWIDAPDRQPMLLTLRRGRKINFTWNNAPVRLDDDVIGATEGPLSSGSAEIEGEAAKLLTPRPDVG